MTFEADAAVLDGRTRRRRRNIDAVIDAVISLAADGNADPTSEEIAEIALISHRSIYRYFDTRADLLEAAVRRAFETAAIEVFGEDSSDGSLEDRIEHFVSARLGIYERIGSIVRVAMAHDSSRGLEHVRSALRSHLAEHFAPEFAAVADDDRHLVASIIDAAFQFDALEYLSGNAGLDASALRTALARQVHCHLAA